LKTLDVARLGSIAVSRAGRELVYLKTGVDITRPSGIRAIVTERCNYKCLYCNHWRQPSYPDEMTLQDWQRALTSLREYVGYYVVQFMGGEPFVWKGFLELIEFCSTANVGWGVVTNGSALSEPNVQRIVAADPINVDVSLDSIYKDVHDRARGVTGSRDKVLEGIRFLSEERLRVGAQFPIRIKATVDRHNFRMLEDLVSWSAGVSGVVVDPSPVRLHKAEDQAYHYVKSKEAGALDLVIERLVQLKRAGAPIETSEAKLRAFGSHFRGETIQHGYDECRVGLRNLNINPAGDVTHCWNFERIGNLRHQSAEEIWGSPLRRIQLQQTLKCPHVSDNTCGMACSSHRNLTQEAKRGLMLLRAR
jgi:radical SAM protein with 4Fe4S-binding SPASM domain